MASKKHELTPADLEKGYEKNDVRIRGIIGFWIGLLVLIVVTFVLIWLFLGALREHQLKEAQVEQGANPMAMSEKEKLPPEPRLQLAPGFGVDSDEGRVNLELTSPNSEYREVKKQWDALQVTGRIDPKTGAVAMLPIEQAKQRLLSMNVKAKNDPDAVKLYNESRRFLSDASSGRKMGEIRR